MPPLPTISHSPAVPTAGQPTAPTPIVVVLGMHRSGTSLCAHILSLLGVDIADEALPGRGNEGGHWERQEIVDFHDAILRFLDRDYYSPKHDLALPNGWWAEPEVRRIKREIERYLQARMRPGELFGFKDPRTARLLPLWSAIFRKLNLTPLYVVCVRSPSQVARSLFVRDETPLPVGEYRWLNYNVDCFRHASGALCAIDYESWFTDRDATLARLIDHVGDLLIVDRFAMLQSIDDTINRDFRHTVEGHPHARRPAIRHFYDLIREPSSLARNRERIDRFVEHFLAFQQILPFDLLLLQADLRAERAMEAQAQELRTTRASLEVATTRERRLDEHLAVHGHEFRRLHAEIGAAGTREHEFQQRLAAQDGELTRLRAELDAAVARERDLLARSAALEQELAQLSSGIGLGADG